MYKQIFEGFNISDKVIEEIFIDYKNPNQLKVKRKGKVVLIKLFGNSVERNSFRDYLIAMTKKLNNKDYELINEKEVFTVDLKNIHITNIPDRFNQNLLNIFNDASIVPTIDTPEYKNKAVEIYKQNS